MSLLFFFKSHYTRHPVSTQDYLLRTAGGLPTKAGSRRRKRKKREELQATAKISEGMRPISKNETATDYSQQNFRLIEEHLADDY